MDSSDPSDSSDRPDGDRTSTVRRFGCGLCLALALAAPALAGPPYKSPAGETVFRQMLLGWCFQKLTGTARIPNSIDPLTWPKFNFEGSADGLNLSADARINKPSRTIVDLASGASCFVEGGELDSSGLIARLRKEIVAAPFNGELINETDTPQARTALYALPVDKAGFAPVVMLYDYKAPAPGVATAVVQLK